MLPLCLSVVSGSIPIASFGTAIGVSVGIMSASCSLAFSIATGFVKRVFKNNKKKE